MTTGHAHPHHCPSCKELWECTDNHAKIHAQLICPKCRTKMQEGR